MTLAAVAVAATMNAQTWVGGSLGFSTSHLQGAEKNTKTFSIAPEIGYNLDDKWSVAVALGYGHSSYSYHTYNTFSVKPYARYTFVKAGDFSFFLDGGLNYETEHMNGAKNNENSFGVFVTPGISYAISEKVGLVAHLGSGLTFDHEWEKDSYHRNTLALDLANGISFGAYYNF